MNIVTCLISFALVVSKYLDCYTTSMNITGISEETNPMARGLMKRLGIQTTIWSIFVTTVIIVTVSNWLVLAYDNSSWYTVGYIILGGLVTVVQLSVALTNHTRRVNPITRLLSRVFERWNR